MYLFLKLKISFMEYTYRDLEIKLFGLGISLKSLKIKRKLFIITGTANPAIVNWTGLAVIFSW